MKADPFNRFIIAFSVFITGAVILVLSYTGTRFPPLDNDGAFTKITFTGTFSVDNGPWIPLDKESDFDLSSRHFYQFRGHFTEDIDENHQIMLRISDLMTQISINGREVFHFGDDLRHSPGNVWHSFTSPGISVDDEVRINLYNYYTKVHPFSVNQFFSQMYAGSPDGLYKMAFRQNGLSMLIGFLIFAVGILEGITALGMLFMKQEGAGRAFCCAGFAVSSGIWFSIQFNIVSLIFPFPAAVNAADVLSAYLMSSFFALYITTYLTGTRKLLGHINSTVSLLYTGITACLIMLGDMDAYLTISVGWALAFVNLFTCVLYLAMEYHRTRDRTVRGFSISLIPIFIGTLLDTLGYWSGTVNETMWLRSCFLLFALIQMTALLWQVKEKYKKAEKIQKLENELLQNRISITLSQIQPHFLFNALTAIAELCVKNPREAEKATLSFSTYLRGNLDSLKQATPIRFEKELQHIQTYLALEKLRFGEELNVLYDIRTTEFSLPSLTIQPLVENAVKHGIGKKETGGTVTISSLETDSDYRVTVSDNGIGFDPDSILHDGKTHIGIDNARSRLAAQCGGRLEIRSRKNCGTTAEAIIPKAMQNP